MAKKGCSWKGKGSFSEDVWCYQGEQNMEKKNQAGINGNMMKTARFKTNEVSLRYGGEVSQSQYGGVKVNGI